MIKEPLLSIVLPVYKGENFLEGCIKSLCNQDLGFDEYEIIVIDDGSPDSSLLITRKLMALYPNIVLVQQKNYGVAYSRNRGMEIARGQWLTFIDQDDLFRRVSLGSIKRIISSTNDDIVKFSISDLDPTNAQSVIVGNLEQTIIKSISGIEFYHWYRSSNIYTGIDAPWSIFYNMTFLRRHSLTFLEGIIYLDDAEFLGRVFCLAERCSFYNFPYYLHNNNPNSVSNSKVIFSDRAINGFIECAQNIINFKGSAKLCYSQRVFLNNLIVKFTLLVLQQPITNKEFNWKRYKRLCKLLKESNLQRVDIEGCSHELAFWGKIYNISKLMFIFMWFGFLVKTSMQSRFRFSKNLQQF